MQFAIKMLIADRAKFTGILLGLIFSTFIITQQSGILVAILNRTFGFVIDTSQADIWVVDKKVSYIEDIKQIRYSELFRVRGIEGIEWAMPLYKSLFRARFTNGTYQSAVVIGIDDATLIGGPPKMVEGSILSLRWPDAVIVNDIGAQKKLAWGPDRPLKIGDTFEIKDSRVIVTGICEVQRTFRSEPVIYTTFSRAIAIDPPHSREGLSFIIVKAKKGVNIEELCNRIKEITQLEAYTTSQFKKLTLLYYLKYTGILINFGFAVLLGFIIGIVIAGQTFYNFGLDNIRYFATFKAMGAKNETLRLMLRVQALFMGFLGYGLGLGFTTLFALITRGTELQFRFPPWLFVLSFVTTLVIILFAATLSLRKIIRLDPAMVFQK